MYQDYKIKEVYASGGWSRMDYVLYLEEEKNLKPDKPNNNKESGSLRFIVKEHNGKESIVVIFKNETDETYSFVNLTRERICSSRFKTIEEAIHDLNDQVRNGLIESYTVKGNHPELSMDEIAQIIKNNVNKEKHMKVKLKNFANIENAEINLNGLTVLTGKTDTRKEYIAKALLVLSMDCMILMIRLRKL